MRNLVNNGFVQRLRVVSPLYVKVLNLIVGKVGNCLTTNYLRFLYDVLPKLYPLRLH